MPSLASSCPLSTPGTAVVTQQQSQVSRAAMTCAGTVRHAYGRLVRNNVNYINCKKRQKNLSKIKLFVVSGAVSLGCSS